MIGSIKNSIGPDPYALSKKSSYERYFQYTLYDKDQAFQHSLQREIEVVKSETSKSCKEIGSDELHKSLKYMIVDPTKFIYMNTTTQQSYFQCKVQGLLSSSSTSATFLKIMGLDPKVLSSGSFGIVSRGYSDKIPVVAKTGMSVFRRKELIHEYTIGVYLKQLTSISRHFPSMYGILQGCGVPYVTADDILTNVCNSYNNPLHDEEPEPLAIGSTHLFLENIQGVPFYDLIDEWFKQLKISGRENHPTSDKHYKLSRSILREFYLIIMQIYAVLATAYKHLSFVHGDLHSKNIMVTELPSETDYTYQLSKSIITIRTKYKISIIDYGFSSLKVNCHIYSDATSFYDTKYVELTADHMSAAEVPWFDVARLIGSISGRTKDRLMADKVTWAAWVKQMNDERLTRTAESDFARGILYLFGMIMDYPKDIVRREQPAPPNYINEMEKLGADTVDYANKKNSFFLTNLTTSNLPSSECLVFMMIRDPAIASVTRGYVGKKNATSFYNLAKLEHMNIKPYQTANITVRDEIDYSIVNANNLKDYRLAFSFEEHVNRLREFAISRNREIEPIEDGYLSKIMYLGKRDPDALTDGKRATFIQFADGVMLTLDTAFTMKTLTEMIPRNMNIPGLKDLIKDTNSFILASNELMSRLTFELYLAIRKNSVQEFSTIIRGEFEITRKYPRELVALMINSYSKIHKNVSASPSHLLKEYTMNGTVYNYLKLTKDMNRDDKKYAYMIMMHIFGEIISEVFLGRNGGNFQAFILRILQFVPIQPVED